MLTGVATFLLILIVLLAIPVRIAFQITWQQAFTGYIRLRWAFGLVHIQLSPFKQKSSSADGQALTQKPARSKRSSGKSKNPFGLIRLPRFRQRISRFINDLWHAIQKRDIRLRVRIGLGDPADTGQLWAIIGPVAGVLYSIKEASFEIEPEFRTSTFELDSSGNIGFVPLKIIYLTLGLFLSSPVWQGVRQMRIVE